MGTARFFVERVAVGRTVLPPDEAHHAGSVLRSSVGEPVELFDGRGAIGIGTIGAIARHRVEIDVVRVEERGYDLRYRIVLAVALGKAHRQSYLVEKCTELGVSGIWAVRSERSVSKPADFASEKWARRAIEASKQCGRAWVPTVEGPFTIDRILARKGEFSVMALAEPDAGAAPFADVLAPTPADSSILVWIGPEGGWTRSERDLLIGYGARSVRLASTILRTETAAVAACAAAALASLSVASPAAQRPDRFPTAPRTGGADQDREVDS